ncbi:MAG: AAA family ATPase [Bacteroidetes bacterium]|nr:AAA family ATPase [Bacteroidota bacterium]
MSIDKIIIENFKIFEGQHVFDLKDLNIYTGPNNSGKSTLIKAISLFSKGLRKSDFPEIELSDNDIGEFSTLVNGKTKSGSFKIGFFIEPEKSGKLFKVMYEFAEGNEAANLSTARFSNIEILDSEDILLMGIYNVIAFKITEDNIEYEYEGDINDLEFPYKTPANGSDQCMLMIKMNVSMLEAYLKLNSINVFHPLLSHLKNIQSIRGNCWLECFMEYNYNYSFNELRLPYLIADLKLDQAFNLGNFEVRNHLYFGLDEPTTGDGGIEKEYIRLKEEIGYNLFVDKVFSPIFQSISRGLELFKETNFNIITFQNFNERLILNNPFSDYLFKLLPSYGGAIDKELERFTRESLKIFGIDGYIRLTLHLNTAIEISLVTGLNETDEQKGILDLKVPKNFHLYLSNPKDDNYSWENMHKSYDEVYSKNPKQNISDLGKGTANLIGLILKSYFVLIDAERRIRQNERTNNSLGRKIIGLPKKLILIEEPEAFLHPNWQSKLADFFLYYMDFSKRYDVRFLIETHSVYLIQKLQYLVAKQKIESENLNILYFNPGTEKEKFFKMEIRKDGIFKNKFGPGFFDETARLTIDILNSQNPN